MRRKRRELDDGTSFLGHLLERLKRVQYSMAGIALIVRCASLTCAFSLDMIPQKFLSKTLPIVERAPFRSCIIVI